MKIIATDEQIKQMAANAINASRPMGMGFLHFNPDSVTTANDLEAEHNGLFVDYFEGRMVKFSAWKHKDHWEVRDENPHPEYQSWCTKYPTWQSLAASVGATVGTA